MIALRRPSRMVAIAAILAACAGEDTATRSPSPRTSSGEGESPHAPAPGSASPADALPPLKEHEVRVQVLLRPVSRRPATKTKRTFWLYRPEPLPKKLGLVIVAPAGGNMLSGKALVSDDRAEHLPYVKAGFIVMAYSLDGDLPAGVSDAAATRALQDYKASQAGLENARAAIDLALEQVPAIDSELVFAAGHGAAGAHALLLAAEEPRVKGVVVYGPMIRLTSDVGAVMAVDQVIPGYAKLVRWATPENRVADIRAPLFIHQSKEDEVVRASETRAYAKRVGERGTGVDYVEVPLGSHQEAMLQDGLPRGVAWLRRKRGD